MKFKEIPEEYYIKVSPRENIFVKNKEYNKDTCYEIIKDIERHVDNVADCRLQCDCIYEIKGRQYDSIYQGLIGELDDVGVDPYYSIYFNKIDNECAMQRYYNNFEELTMEFYNNPKYFERVDWNKIDNITKEQIDFLKKVVDFRNKADD